MHLQSQSVRNVFQLAYHFDAAEKATWRSKFALQAAELARSQHSLEIAEQQYRIAERGATPADQTSRYRILEGLGDVLMLRGRYAASAELFDQAALVAEGRFARAQIQGKLGELALKRGDMESAAQSFEQALRMLGRLCAAQHIHVCSAVGLGDARTGASYVISVVSCRPPEMCPTQPELLSWRLFSRLAHGYWFVRNKIHVL